MIRWTPRLLGSLPKAAASGEPKDHRLLFSFLDRTGEGMGPGSQKAGRRAGKPSKLYHISHAVGLDWELEKAAAQREEQTHGAWKPQQGWMQGRVLYP